MEPASGEKKPFKDQTFVGSLLRDDDDDDDGGCGGTLWNNVDSVGDSSAFRPGNDRILKKQWVWGKFGY